MNMVSWYIEQSKCSTHPEIAGVGGKIRTLKFTFPCNMATRDESERIRLFGTGGKLLAALKRLMANLKNLKKLELIDLMLEPKEAEHLLDEVCEICCLTLRTLVLVNTTRVQYQVLHVGVFLNLQVLANTTVPRKYNGCECSGFSSQPAEFGEWYRRDDWVHQVAAPARFPKQVHSGWFGDQICEW